MSTMSSKSLINLTELSMTAPTFKSAALNDATKKIIALYKDATTFVDNKNREMAKILATVATAKSYELDGFKSVADYAKQTFGIDRQNAYSLASAGKVYNNAKANAELKAMSPSKLAELSRVDEKVVENAIKDGKISKNSTQKELRDFANENTKKDSEKPKIEPTYTARFCSSTVPGDVKDELKNQRTISEWENYFSNYFESLSGYPVETIKLAKIKLEDGGETLNIERRLFVNYTFSMVVELKVYKSDRKKSKAPIVKYNKEQLLKMLAELEEDSNTVNETEEKE